MTLTKIRENLYVPVDFEKNHNYYADPNGEKAYTGITTILNVLAKPALIPWAVRMACDHIESRANGTMSYTHTELQEWIKEARTAHQKKKEAAGVHGTDAHSLVEKYVLACIQHTQGKPMPATNIIIGEESISKFIDWAMENVDHFLFSERRMANPELFVAGTADFAYVGKDGKRYMGDFKTSSGIYGIDYFLQVAAYRLLAESEGDAPYDGSAIVRLGKDGAFEAVYRFDYETDKRAFLACLEIYRAQATFVKPKKAWKGN